MKGKGVGSGRSLEKGRGLEGIEREGDWKWAELRRGAGLGRTEGRTGSVGQNWDLWGRTGIYGAELGSVGQNWELWGRTGICRAEMGSMGQNWDLWGRVSVPAGVGIPYCGVWGRAAARGGPGNRLGRGCRGGRPAEGAKVRGQRSGRAMGVGSEGLTTRWRLAPPPKNATWPSKMAAPTPQDGSFLSAIWRPPEPKMAAPSRKWPPPHPKWLPLPTAPPSPPRWQLPAPPTPHPSSNMAAPSPQDGGSRTWAAILPEATHRA